MSDYIAAIQALVVPVLPVVLPVAVALSLMSWIVSAIGGRGAVRP